MKRTATGLAALLLCCAATRAVGAQTVEFTVPDQLDLAEGRLSVTFRDGVTEETARALLAASGFEPLAWHFEPVTLVAVTAQPLAETQLEQLRAAPTVRAAMQREVDRTVAGAWRYEVAVTFAAPTSEEQARAFVREQAPGLWVQRVEKRPNEAVIRVEVGQEEEAVTELEQQAPVKYVSYIHAAQ